MTLLDQTTALIRGFASAVGVAALPTEDGGGYRITVGEDTHVLVYGGDDETILIVAPIMKLPFWSDYAVALYLLRINMIDSPVEPFRVAADAAGGLILWARLPIEQLVSSFAVLANGLGRYVAVIRTEFEGEIAELA
jgi:hypothetical protein